MEFGQDWKRHVQHMPPKIVRDAFYYRSKVSGETRKAQKTTDLLRSRAFSLFLEERRRKNIIRRIINFCVTIRTSY